MDVFGIALLFGPAIVALVLVAGGIKLIRHERDEGSNGLARLVVGSLMLAAALGIGTCYGIVFSSLG